MSRRAVACGGISRRVEGPGQSSRDARPQRNARKPTGTGHVDKFPRPKPRDRTEFSPEAMEKMVDSFDKNPYPGIGERVRLATLAGVEEGRIQACKKPTPQVSYSRFSSFPHYHDDNRRQRPIFRAAIDSTGTEEKEPQA
nr:hypothetical protein BaRGS_028750 [Batillaria attramentaria]